MLAINLGYRTFGLLTNDVFIFYKIGPLLAIYLICFCCKVFGIAEPEITDSFEASLPKGILRVSDFILTYDFSGCYST